MLGISVEQREQTFHMASVPVQSIQHLLPNTDNSQLAVDHDCGKCRSIETICTFIDVKKLNIVAKEQTSEAFFQFEEVFTEEHKWTYEDPKMNIGFETA